jgi:tetratricopeptide (TPR) repeat protein
MKSNTRTVTIPTNTTTFFQKTIIENLFQEGLKLHQQSRFIEAEKFYTDVLKLDQNHSNSLHLLGVINFIRKNHQQALELINASIISKPDFALALSNRGLVLQEFKRFNESLKSYDNALIINPYFAEAFSNRGLALQELKRFDESHDSYINALRINPNYTEAFYNNGLALKELKRFNEAIESLDQAIKIDPYFSQAYSNRGLILKEVKQFKESIQSFHKALIVNPIFSDAIFNLGNTLQQIQKFDESLDCYDNALIVNPNYAEALSNRGNALKELQRFDESLESYQKALLINPNLSEALSNRGLVLQELRQFDRSLESFEKALIINPNLPEALLNRGVVLQQFKRFSSALSCYENALIISPGFTDGMLNKALCLLLLGDFENGLIYYEWRLKNTNSYLSSSYFDNAISLQDKKIKTKTILIRSEQGLGDTIQFCRYLILLKSLGGKIFFEVEQKLIRLLKTSFQDICEFIPKGSPLPYFDYVCPLISLPLVFDTRFSNLPSNSIYLQAIPELVQFWNLRIDDSKFNIGIAWQGSQSKIDAGRSFPLTLFYTLSLIPKVRLISLQKGFGTEQLESLPKGMKVTTLGEDFDSGSDAFIDTAAVMNCLDLVITSDTSIAHLGGALGVPTWVALKFVPDWRWFLDRIDSPWYPSLRLFRQKERDNWISVFEDIKAELITLIDNE